MSQARQLAAIMFTDIVGYTRLMGQSEEKALVVLQQNRAVQKPLIAAHNGRFIKELGDGTMASFDKASDAVRCAIGIQKASKEFPDLNLRIGIHLGEVVFENEDVFGDGVNIAARIESAGKAGAIYISGAVHGTVHNRDDIETRFVERMQLKNVSRPIEIHEVAVDGKFCAAAPKAVARGRSITKRQRLLIGAVASLLLLAGAYSLWGKKAMGRNRQVDHASIAVLPFTNMSSDAENEFFCDGVTEDILTHLSKLKNLKVISRTSVMHFKGTTLSIPEIAEQLGVDYILEGSVRKQGDQVAITAQLIHAADDGHLWAENYERSLENVFAIQREVAQEIARVLNITISLAERDGLSRSSTENVEAYQLYLKGRESGNDRSELGLRKGIALLQQAVDRDPLYVDAMAQQVYYIQMLGQYGYASRDSCIQAGQVLVDAAFAIDTMNALAHVAKAEVIFQRNLAGDTSWVAFRNVAQRAVELGPNSAEAHFMFARALYSKEAEKALAEYRTAASLDPYHSRIKVNLVYALMQLQRYQEALDYLQANDALIKLEDIKLEQTIACHFGLKQWSKALELQETRVSSDMSFEALEGHAFRHYCLTGDAAWSFGLLDPALRNYQGNFNWWNFIYYGAQAGRSDHLRMLLDTATAFSSFTDEVRTTALALLAHYEKDDQKALGLLRERDMRTTDRYLIEAHLGHKQEVLDFLRRHRDEDPYNRACLFALIGETDSALHQFDKVTGWEMTGWSRFDMDLDAIRNEPRYQAKVASYDFPPLKQ